MFQRILRILDLIIYLLLGVLLLTASDPVSNEPAGRARAFTRPIEFDYFSWSVDAALLKLQSGAAGLPYYLDNAARKQAVMGYMYLTERILQAENQLNLIYADPGITDKETATAHLRTEIARLQSRQDDLMPLGEATLQEQVGAVLADLDLTTGGQPVPPLLYHSSAVPMGLVISPRDHIEQLANISIQPNLSVDQQATLEDLVANELDVSTLVVGIGGVGVYPTMVMRTTSLPWLSDTIAHEWAHNFLTLRPLGLLYDTTPELRTMNETTASIVGVEVGALVMQRYYPELVGATPSAHQLASVDPAVYNLEDEPPVFDFRAEMHETRVTADELLAEGKTEEAEAYMESRRELFWQNGYAIRKLNQAYFAFYGAYADVPGGPAGEDPVGPAVRALRAQSGSLAEFVDRISWMTSFEQLQAAIQ
jgi:hypothetical protein